MSVTKILDLQDLKNLPIFLFLPDSNSFQESVVPLHHLYAFDKTAHALKTFYEYTSKKYSASYTFINRIELLDFLNFIHQTKGNLTKFWLPIFINHFKLTRNIKPDDFTIWIEQSQLSLSIPPEHLQKIRLFIYKPITNQKVFCLTRRILACHPESDFEEKLTLSSPLGITLTVEEPVLISRLALVRFSTSQFSLKFFFNLYKDQNLSVLATIKLDFLELPFEYLNL